MKWLILDLATLHSIWSRVCNTKSSWSFLEGSSFTEFSKAMLNSAGVIGMRYGIVRLTDWYPAHSCRVHALFWSKGIFRDYSELIALKHELMSTFGMKRIECIIPSNSKSLRRLISCLGFQKEGTLRCYYDLDGTCADGDIYSIIASPGRIYG